MKALFELLSVICDPAICLQCAKKGQAKYNFDSQGPVEREGTIATQLVNWPRIALNLAAAAVNRK